MADENGEKPEPTLELPSLFGRKRKRRREDETVPEPEPVDETVPEPEPVPASPPEQSAAGPAPQPVAAAASSTRSWPPALPARAVVLATGLAVGLVGTLLTYLGLRGCELVRGTDSCGGGPGGGLLVAILLLMVLLGAVVLALMQVPEPRSTSFLAVGIVTVVLLLFLLEVVFSPWMFAVVPAVSAASYLLAHWVSTRFVELPDRGPGVDVR
jgi:hypothetical protein